MTPSRKRAARMDALSLVRWNISDRRGKLRMSRGINGSVLDFGACRVLAEKVVTFPVFRWPDGPRHEAAAAVRADVTKNSFNAGRAERALISANARFG